MNLQTLYLILFLALVLIPILCAKKGRQMFGETWFGFLLIFGGVSFLISALTHDQIVWVSRRFGTTILDRWQIGCLGFLGTGFGVAWIYGPLRRWFKKKNDCDDNDAA